MATNLLRAEFVGVRTLKARLSAYLRNNHTLVVTDRGRPKRVILGYDDAIDLLEMIEEARDRQWRREVNMARRAYARGGGVPFDGAALRRRVGLRP